jgi:hypothetical protein
MRIMKGDRPRDVVQHIAVVNARWDVSEFGQVMTRVTKNLQHGYVIATHKRKRSDATSQRFLQNCHSVKRWQWQRQQHTP